MPLWSLWPATRFALVASRTYAEDTGLRRCPPPPSGSPRGHRTNGATPSRPSWGHRSRVGQAVEKGPAARRRPKAAGEAYSLYVEPAAEGANEADGPLSAACRGRPRSRWTLIRRPAARAP